MVSPKGASTVAKGATKLLFGKTQTPHPTRVFSLKKGRGVGENPMGVIPGGLVTNKGRGRGRGTRPVTTIPTTAPTPTEAPPPTDDIIAEGKSSTQEEQFEDGVEEDEDGRKEPAKPKRYSSQRQRTSEEEDVKQVDNPPAPATTTMITG